MKRLILGLLLVFGVGSPPASAQRPTKEDEKIISELTREMRDLQLKAQAESEDLIRYTQYQEEIVALVRTALAKVSPEARPALQVTLTVMGPLQQESNDYLTIAAARIQAGIFELGAIQNKEDIASRVAELSALRARNERLLARINRIDDDLKQVLAESSLNAAQQRAFVAGFNREFGRRVGPMKAVRRLETALYDQFVIALQHLESHWGAWSTTEEGPFQWTDAAAQEKFEAIAQEIQTIAARQAEAERVFTERLQGR
jgi:hypothetical protein